MAKHEKMEIIRLVESSDLPKAVTLDKFKIQPSTYYRWVSNLKKYGMAGLVDKKPHHTRM